MIGAGWVVRGASGAGWVVRVHQALYLQSRGNLRAELTAQVALRSGRVARRPQSRATAATRGPPQALDR